jgi:hypothetical protein
LVLIPQCSVHLAVVLLMMAQLANEDADQECTPASWGLSKCFSALDEFLKPVVTRRRSWDGPVLIGEMRQVHVVCVHGGWGFCKRPGMRIGSLKQASLRERL